MKGEIVKFIGIFFVILIILDLVLFIMGKVSALVFWMAIIISAVVAYKVLPALRSK